MLLPGQPQLQRPQGLPGEFRFPWECLQLALVYNYVTVAHLVTTMDWSGCESNKFIKQCPRCFKMFQVSKSDRKLQITDIRLCRTLLYSASSPPKLRTSFIAPAKTRPATLDAEDRTWEKTGGRRNRLKTKPSEGSDFKLPATRLSIFRRCDNHPWSIILHTQLQYQLEYPQTQMTPCLPMWYAYTFIYILIDHICLIHIYI